MVKLITGEGSKKMAVVRGAAFGLLVVIGLLAVLVTLLVVLR